MNVDIPIEEFEKQLDHVSRQMIGFLRELPELPGHFGRPKTPDVSKINNFSRSIEDIVNEYMSNFKSSGINTASGKFMGYIPGGGLLSASLADFMAAITNPYSGYYSVHPTAQLTESEVIKWMIEFTGIGDNAWGVLTSGGATANLIACLSARKWKNENHKTATKAYVTSQAHHTMNSAFNIAGIQDENIEVLDVDENHRLDVDSLKRKLEDDRQKNSLPWFVCLNAGATNTGMVDSIDDAYQLSKEYNFWLHIDGAYGGFFALCDEVKHHFKGLENAHSITLDPHKGLFMPYGTGAILVRDSAYLRNDFKPGDYLQDILSNDISQVDYSLELTRHFRSLRVWLSLQLHGVDRFKEALKEKLELTKFTQKDLSKNPYLEFHTENPDLSVVAFRIKNDVNNEKTHQLHQYIIDQGDFYLSTTKLKEKMYIRICILSFRTHLEHIEDLLGQIHKFSYEISDKH